ncbi:MAG: hypothetical protein WCJ35_17465 [Planctomycetota bacterium]
MLPAKKLISAMKASRAAISEMGKFYGTDKADAVISGILALLYATKAALDEIDAAGPLGPWSGAKKFRVLVDALDALDVEPIIRASTDLKEFCLWEPKPPTGK